MKLLRSLFLMFFAGASVFATTVIPPTFDQLVNDAELIFQGTVTATNPRWVIYGSDKYIVTDVTFRIEESIKGLPGESYTIQVMGGTIDGATLDVDGPKFKVGDRDILFVEHNRQQFIPLVGIMHGRFRVQKDSAGRETVTKDSGISLASVDKLGTDERGAVNGPALAASDFKAAIRERLLHPRR